MSVEHKKHNKASGPNSLKVVAYGLIMVALTFAGTFAAIETYFRYNGMFGPSPYKKSDIRGLYFEMRPNFVYDSSHGVVKLNSEGFRDREFRHEKPKGTLRMACLGDSMTVGVEMPVEKVYVKALESRLKERGLRTEAMNMAVGGYNTAQEWLVWLHKAEKYEPDLVTVQFTLNDLTYIYPFYIGEGLVGRIKLFLGEHFHFYRFFSYVKKRRMGDVNVDQSRGLSAADLRGMPVSLDFMESVYDSDGKYFREWKEAVANFGNLNKRGTPVLFIIYPWPIYTDMDKGKPYPYYPLHRQVERVLRNNGIPYVDVTPVLNAHGNLHDFWATPMDFHLNAEAHAIVADAILSDVEALLDSNH